jgi:sugar lactone lactonase YvrE
MLTQTVAGRTYDYSHAVGGRYIGQPCSLAMGAGGLVYALLRGSENIGNVPWNKTGSGSRVARINIPTEARAEEILGEFGKYGDGDGEFIWPTGLALDNKENSYITDEWMNRVSSFDKDGNFLGLWGTTGEGDGEFNGPAGIAVDQEGNLFIVDSRNNRIQKMTKDGRFLDKWGKLGSDEGEFNAPWGITIDHQGFVYVADHKNHRAQKFTPEGEFVASFGREGSGQGQLNRPTDVAVDPEGDVYVCDWANNRVVAFAPDGDYITDFIGDAEQLAMWHQQTVDANVDVIKARRRVDTLEPEWRLTMPRAVAFDAEKGRIIIADSQRGRFQIYTKVKGYQEPQFNL